VVKADYALLVWDQRRAKPARIFSERPAGLDAMDNDSIFEGRRAAGLGPRL